MTLKPGSRAGCVRGSLPMGSGLGALEWTQPASPGPTTKWATPGHRLISNQGKSGVGGRTEGPRDDDGFPGAGRDTFLMSVHAETTPHSSPLIPVLPSGPAGGCGLMVAQRVSHPSRGLIAAPAAPLNQGPQPRPEADLREGRSHRQTEELTPHLGGRLS